MCKSLITYIMNNYKQYFKNKVLKELRRTRTEIPKCECCDKILSEETIKKAYWYYLTIDQNNYDKMKNYLY